MLLGRGLTENRILCDMDVRTSDPSDQEENGRVEAWGDLPAR